MFETMERDEFVSHSMSSQNQFSAIIRRLDFLEAQNKKLEEQIHKINTRGQSE